MKVKFPKEQIDLFNQIGSIISTNENVYRYFPFWFKETGEEDVYELLPFEKLPNEVIETIKDMRNPNSDLGSVMHYVAVENVLPDELELVWISNGK